MNAAHLHLALNHAPLFGLLFAVLALAWTLFRANATLGRAALVLLMLSGVLVLPIYLTGEEAEHVVEEQAGVSHDAIEVHEDAAFGAAVAVGLLGLVALGLLVGFRRKPLPRSVTATVLVLTLAASAWIGYVANLGGQVSHPELRSDAAAQTLPAPGEAAHDD